MFWDHCLDQGRVVRTCSNLSSRRWKRGHGVYKTEFGRTMTENKVNRRIQEILDFWMSGTDWLLQEKGNRVEDVSRFMGLGRF